MVADLTKSELRNLQSHHAVDDVEDEGMDEGRFFVHLDNEHHWEGSSPDDLQRTKSFGNFKEARRALDKNVIAD